jgi:hypothetical protein
MPGGGVDIGSGGEDAVPGQIEGEGEVAACFQDLIALLAADKAG